MTNHHIIEENLSIAWGRAFLQVWTSRGKEISPLVISISGFHTDGLNEVPEIRESLDSLLKSREKLQVDSIANTIFPQSLWRLSKGDRHRMFDLYKRSFPRIKGIEPIKNSRGLYFERLTSFGSGPNLGNQLEYIISCYNSRQGVRRSMFQASVFDPARDHVTTAQLVFPCLQHISFVPSAQGLVLNAFYATQQLLEKAYGNYLGLCRLGQFMAHEMGLELHKMNCFVGVEKIDTAKKSDRGVVELVKMLEKKLG